MDEIAAAYVRTSQEKDDAFSLDSQIEAIRQFAVASRLDLPPEYKFREEFTGKLLDRPKLSKLRTLIKEGKVTAVIVYATDRLARKVGVADILLDELFSYNVKLYIVQWGSYVKDTPEDRLRFNFEATFSDFERRKIAERTTRGKKDKVRQGIYLGTGKPPYGYRKVGEKREMRLVIIEEQAAIIRQIFQWYAVEHVPVTHIMRRLSGTPSPSECEGVRNFPHKRRPKGEWADATLYIILKTTAYAGSMKNYGSTVDVPAIVDPEVFALAQERLAIGREQSFRNQTHQYLMSRRLKCKFCDYTIQTHPHSKDRSITGYYYRCPSWRIQKAKPKCALPGFRVDAVDAAVWDWVRNLILHPESLRVMLEESQKELQEHTQDLKYRLTRADDRLQEAEKRLAIVLREYIDIEARADASPAAATIRDVYRQAKEQSEQLFTELTEECEKLRNQLSVSTIDDTFIDDLTTFAEVVREDIDNLPYSGQRELIEQMGVFGELAWEDKQRVLYIIWHTHIFRKVLTVSRPP
jgi:site-specific DNA recombinase